MGRGVRTRPGKHASRAFKQSQRQQIRTVAVAGLRQEGLTEARWAEEAALVLGVGTAEVAGSAAAVGLKAGSAKVAGSAEMAAAVGLGAGSAEVAGTAEVAGLAGHLRVVPTAAPKRPWSILTTTNKARRVARHRSRQALAGAARVKTSRFRFRFRPNRCSPQLRTMPVHASSWRSSR